MCVRAGETEAGNRYVCWVALVCMPDSRQVSRRSACCAARCSILYLCRHMLWRPDDTRSVSYVFSPASLNLKIGQKSGFPRSPVCLVPVTVSADIVSLCGVGFPEGERDVWDGFAA